MKIVTVIGARPQFIKAAPVCREIRAADMTEILVHTGQHYDENLSDIFFQEMEIPKPDHHLGVGSGTHGAQTGRMLEGLEQILLREKPDFTLVYGDTNSTLAGALAAAKLHVRVAHIEAGLRSFNRHMPEEINRVLTDQVSEVLFAPTPTAIANLIREGIAPEKIHMSGDVMYDAALYYGKKAQKTSTALDRLVLKAGSYVLATIHRAENTDDPARLKTIFEALARIAQIRRIVLPLHPRTRQALHRLDSQFFDIRGLSIIEPVGYLDMVMLEKNACLIVTDSGGVQKEAFFYEIPCATLRTETEWVELVDAGWNTLVPPYNPDTVFELLSELLQKPSSRLVHEPLYGTGDAAKEIVKTLKAASPAAGQTLSAAARKSCKTARAD